MHRLLSINRVGGAPILGATLTSSYHTATTTKISARFNTTSTGAAESEKPTHHAHEYVAPTTSTNSRNNNDVNNSTAASSSSSAGASAVTMTPEAQSLQDARRKAFLESQAEWERINRQQEAQREKLRQQASRNTGLASNTKLNTDVKLKKKSVWGGNQLRDAWSTDAMSRHDKDSIDKRLGSENRYNPFERDRRVMRIMIIWAVPSWLFGLGVVYWYATGNYPWEADYQHLLNILRQYDQSPRSKLYLYRSDNQIKRDATHGPRAGEAA